MHIGMPSDEVTARADRHKDGTHVVVVRFTSRQDGGRWVNTNQEVMRLAALRRLIDELTEIADEAGV
ncbi:hypothetical protein [Nonomuraea roseola]|uniref:Uncharacterized protein n=1 Tax=Nonomuraea roseola TaxID=46179 RepID=A0ABV5Q152_9ACTN